MEEDFSIQRLVLWNIDGSFRGFLDVPSSVDPYSVHFNDLGQAIGLTTGSQVMVLDNMAGAPRNASGPGGHTISESTTSTSEEGFVGVVIGVRDFVAAAFPVRPSLAKCAISAAVGLAIFRYPRRLIAG